ncbi:SDR family oxidoreductase [Streptomyces hoynatensis]|uniref:SDR family oxidoreductase n=1 Tax=Streptomyces hoynatensis TaxID=1141874 RepID=UPI003BABEAFC
MRRLVLLTAHGVGEADGGHPLRPAERAVRESGVAWTILRPDWFAQNFGEGFWLPLVRGGTPALPTGEGRTPFVDAEDIAEVAVAALTGEAAAAGAWSRGAPTPPAGRGRHGRWRGRGPARAAGSGGGLRRPARGSRRPG